MVLFLSNVDDIVVHLQHSSGGQPGTHLSCSHGLKAHSAQQQSSDTAHDWYPFLLFKYAKGRKYRTGLSYRKYVNWGDVVCRAGAEAADRR